MLDAPICKQVAGFQDEDAKPVAGYLSMVGTLCLCHYAMEEGDTSDDCWSLAFFHLHPGHDKYPSARPKSGRCTSAARWWATSRRSPPRVPSEC